MITWRSERFRRERWFSAFAVFCAACSTQATVDQRLTAEDIEAIRELNLAYPAAWVANDPDAVMLTLADDAVLIPALGTTPVKGAAAIREFFWPADAPPSTVPVFTMSPEEIDGTRDVAYVWGTMSLSFAVEEEGATQLYSTAGNYLMVMRRDDGDQWKIARYIWNHPPWEPS
jgi:uncharacterized protein (TIGR02246 family)